MITIASKRAVFALLAGILVLVAGCSSEVFTETAEGTVTLDGAPLADVHVEFIPDVPEGTKANGSSAVTDGKGFFRLTRNDNQRPGALVGKHHVVVYPGRAAQDKDDMTPAKSVQVPAIYSNAAKTPLIVEVTQHRKTYEVRLNKSGAVQRP